MHYITFIYSVWYAYQYPAHLAAARPFCGYIIHDIIHDIIVHHSTSSYTYTTHSIVLTSPRLNLAVSYSLTMQRGAEVCQVWVSRSCQKRPTIYQWRPTICQKRPTDTIVAEICICINILCIYVHAHTHTHLYIHTYIHAHVCMHTYIHTHAHRHLTNSCIFER